MQSRAAAKVFICIALMAATTSVYWSVFSSDFVDLDDSTYVTQNQHVLKGLSWSGWRYAWTTRDCSNWHPLTWISLEIDGSISGSNPLGYHITNLVLHLVNSLLLFFVLQQLTSTLFRSGMVAGLFALHPLHVESVAWISERKDVLSTFFLLLTVSAYASYTTRPSWVRYLAVLLLFGLGLLSKPMLVTVPILLILLDAWPLKRVEWKNSSVGANAPPSSRFPLWRLLIEKIPFFILSFADGVMTIVAQIGTVKIMNDVPMGTRVANMFHAYDWYLWKTFVPTGLTAFYPHPESSLPWSLVWTGVLVFFGISLWAVLRRNSEPYLLFGWLWFAISLLPVIGLLQVGGQAYADRYAYIPHIGLFILIVWQVHAVLAGSAVGRLASGLLAVSALTACGIVTREQVGHWKNSEKLWTHAIEILPQNAFAHSHLGDLYFLAGDHERAIGHIAASLQSKRSGNLANAYCNWGRSLAALNRPAEAEQRFLEALRINSEHDVALYQLEKLLRNQGRIADAEKIAERLAAIVGQKAKPTSEDAATHYRRGAALLKQGRAGEALVHFERAVQLAPQSVDAYFNLAHVQVELKLNDAAKSNFKKAIQLDSESAFAHFGLAELLEAEHDFAGAKKHFAEVVRITPNDVEAKQRLDGLRQR